MRRQRLLPQVRILTFVSEDVHVGPFPLKLFPEGIPKGVLRRSRYQIFPSVRGGIGRTEFVRVAYTRKETTSVSSKLLSYR